MPRKHRTRVCRARMEIVDLTPSEPLEVEYMELADELEPPKMVQPRKPKKKEQRLPGVKLLRRINKDREEENIRKREEQLNKREEALNARERKNNINIGEIDNETFLDKLRRMQLHP